MDSKEIEWLFGKVDIRITPNRLLVFRELLNADCPLSLSDLEEKLFPADKSSIFRTLSIFSDRGIVHSIEDGSGSTKYEVCPHPGECEPEEEHIHFFCESCRRTFCISSQKVPRVSLPEGFSVSGINFTVKGVCKDCNALSGES